MKIAGNLRFRAVFTGIPSGTGNAINGLVMMSNSSSIGSAGDYGQMAEPTKAIVQCCESRKRRLGRAAEYFAANRVSEAGSNAATAGNAVAGQEAAGK